MEILKKNDQKSTKQSKSSPKANQSVFSMKAFLTYHQKLL